MSFLVWSVGTAAALSFCVSAGVAVVLVPRERRPRLSVAIRARLWELAAALPLVVVLVAMTATLLPGLIGADHCTLHGGHHPHLCPIHTVGIPAPWLSFAALLLVLRIAWSLARSCSRARRSATFIAKLRARTPSRHGAHVLDLSAPMAFVLGLTRPHVYVSEGLVGAAERGEIDLDVVLAHERGHARARHPLRRLLASLALSFHLPGIARMIERKIALAHEASADRDAADEVGDSLRVAEALVSAARMAQRTPQWEPGIGGSDIEARVRELLAPRARGGTALAFGLGIGATLFSVLALVESPHVHHAIETVLGWLHA